jgi:uncharacterized protein (DUF885 family)
MKKRPYRLFKFAFMLTTIVAIGVLGYLTFSPNHRFARVADAYFDHYYFPENPTAATSAGIHRYDNQLEDYSKARVDYQIKELEKYADQVKKIDPTALNEQTQGDRELLLYSIKSQLLTLQSIRPWEKNPDTYSSGITNSAYVLMSRNFASPETRLRALIAREKQMPAALMEAQKNLKNPPKVFTEVALEQLPGIIHFFEHDVPLAFKDVGDSQLKQQFEEANAAVIKALRDYQTWLKKDLLPRSHGDFRIGAETFRKKLWYDDMVDTPLNKLIELDMADMRRNQKEFARVAKAIDPKKTPKQVLAMMMAEYPPPQTLLTRFANTFDELIQFIKDKHIITIPSDVRPILEETPPFMRALTFASMDVPGPYEKKAKEAYFNVTLPEASWTKDKTHDFMKLFNNPVISSIAIHETYPGHYVQFLWVPLVRDRVRKLIGANTNAEGWAHYCEQMMLDEGFGPHGTDAKSKRELNMLRLGELMEALLRNARFVVGIKMHTGQMTFDEAVKFFETEGYQSHATSVVETKRGTSNPTYLYYTLGKLQILQLRADVQAKEGAAFNLQKFHDDFMRQGFPPIRIVRRAMLG